MTSPNPYCLILAIFFGMFHCVIESYRNIESYCRIRSLFKSLTVSFPAYLSKIFKSCKVLRRFSIHIRIWKFLKHRSGLFPQAPKSWNIRTFWKFSANFLNLSNLSGFWLSTAMFERFLQPNLRGSRISRIRRRYFPNLSNIAMV